jgi:hypothetical protein
MLPRRDAAMPSVLALVPPSAKTPSGVIRDPPTHKSGAHRLPPTDSRRVSHVAVNASFFTNIAEAWKLLKYRCRRMGNEFALRGAVTEVESVGSDGHDCGAFLRELRVRAAGAVATRSAAESELIGGDG